MFLASSATLPNDRNINMASIMPALNQSHEDLDVQTLFHRALTITKADFPTEAARAEAFQITRALFARLESPEEAFLRIGWQVTCMQAALKVAADLNLFEWLEYDTSKGRSSRELAEKAGADPAMLSETILAESFLLWHYGRFGIGSHGFGR